MTFGDRLKAARKNCHLNQEEVSQKIGVARATYSRYETNEREPNVETIKKLANIYNVSADFLVNTNKYNQEAVLTETEQKLLSSYNQLNYIGKTEAQKRVEELTLIDKYSNMLKVAARGGNITELPDSDLIDEDIKNSEDPDFL